MTDEFDDIEEMVPATDVFRRLVDAYVRNGEDSNQAKSVALSVILSRLSSEHTFAYASACEIDSTDPRPGENGLIFHPLDFYVNKEMGRVPVQFWWNFEAASEGNCWFDEVTGDFRFCYSDAEYRSRDGVAYAVYLHRRGLPPVSIPSWVNDLRSNSTAQTIKTEAIEAPSKRNGGRGPAKWWPDFAEELAIYCLKEDPPEGSGTEGQSAMIEAIFKRMAERGKSEPSRTTVQPVINEILRRWRSAGN